MFSIFHGLFTIIALGVDDFNKNINNINNKLQAKKDGALTYYGSRGNEYLVENDKWVYTKKTSNGEDVIADMKTGEIYYNLSRIKKDKKSEICLKQGKTVRYKMENECYNSYYGKYKQPFHKVDIKSDIPVAEISINCIRFYVELDNALVLRPTDEYLNKTPTGLWSVDDLIYIINQRQKELTSKVNQNNIYTISEELFCQNCIIYIDKDKNVNMISKLFAAQQLPVFYRKDGLKYNEELKRWV